MAANLMSSYSGGCWRSLIITRGVISVISSQFQFRSNFTNKDLEGGGR